MVARLADANTSFREHGRSLLSKLRDDHRLSVARELDDDYVDDCHRAAVLIAQTETILQSVHLRDCGGQSATDRQSFDTLRANEAKRRSKGARSLAETAAEVSVVR